MARRAFWWKKISDIWVFVIKTPSCGSGSDFRLVSVRLSSGAELEKYGGGGVLLLHSKHPYLSPSIPPLWILCTQLCDTPESSIMQKCIV